MSALNNVKNNNIKAHKLVKQIVLLKSNKHYRFGDVVFKKGHYWKKSRNYIVSNSELRNTILYKYLNSLPKNSWNTNESMSTISTMLKQVVAKHILLNNNIPLPSPNELVIHLRTGDWAYKPNFLTYNYVALIKKYIIMHGITKCTFCTAFHYGDYEEKKLWMFNEEIHNKNIQKLKELFINVLQNCNVKIDVYSNRDPDLDFIYMLKARHFVGRDGGFANIINLLRRSR